MPTIEPFKDWLRARDEVRRLDEALSKAKQRMREAEERGLQVCEREGIQKLSIDGTTVFLKRSLRASVKGGHREDAVAAFQAEGLGDLVTHTMNAQTLSAYVREREKQGEEIPPTIAAHLNVAELYTLSARSAQSE